MSKFERLPESLTDDELVEQWVILKKIEEELKDVEEGRVYSTEEVKHELKR